MPTASPNRAMCKGMPTFRAGGVTSRIEYFNVGDQGNGRKNALAPTYFSHNHFSSSLADAKDPIIKQTRVAVKLLEGNSLLVSDLLTGTSDPLALLWVSSSEEGEVDLKSNKRVQSTEVRKRTVDPVWDAEFVFPLAIQSVADVMSGRLNILVRDHDDADGDVHYVDLGRVSVPLETVLKEGNIMAHIQLVQLPAKWYPLQRCRGIKKSRGAVKIAIGVFFGPDPALFRDEDVDDVLEDGTSKAARFEHYMRKLRGSHGENNYTRSRSTSPPRRGPHAGRELTARGGTAFVRPKSAPEVTTLTSPPRARQHAFVLKPIQPRFPIASVQTGDPSHNALKDRATAQSPEAYAIETDLVSERRSPKKHSPSSSLERQPDDATVVSQPVEVERARPNSDTQEELHNEQRLTLWRVNSPPVTTSVRPSSKLSHLASKATRKNHARGRSPGAPVGWDEPETATVRAYRWQRRLIESLQRLEDRSTERMAYGELRAIVREATPVQVGRVVTAARGVGTACSLSARKLTLRLFAWACWDQHQAANRHHVGIISYVLDRVRDDETASLRDDLAMCVSAVMLSALRNGTADACMTQIRRFLKIVGEQRKTVRESAGVCCVASILPPPPNVPVEIETGLRSIDDVRIAVGQAAERGCTANSVPKDAVLLPGGRVVFELVDAEAAACFFDRISPTAGGLPANWRFQPFPEDFCVGVNHTKAAHHARLTVHSEEILATLLEALGNGRSEATRGQLFDAIGGMAKGCATFEGDELEPSYGTPHVMMMNEGGAAGISATLKKGLPAIVRAILQVLDCPMRRAHTWKERKAALGLVISLAVLDHLRGAEGPLGEYRAKLIQGSTSMKHDSVAAVRESAREALKALDATEAEQGRGHAQRPLSAPPACATPFGFGGRGVAPPEARQKFQRRGETGLSCTNQAPRMDKLLRDMRKAEGQAKGDVVETSPHNDRLLGKSHSPVRTRGLGRHPNDHPQTELMAELSPMEFRSPNKSQQDSPPICARQPTEGGPRNVAKGSESEHKNDRQGATDQRTSLPRVNPELLSLVDQNDVDGVCRTSRQLERQHCGDEGPSLAGAGNAGVSEVEDNYDGVIFEERQAKPKKTNGPIMTMHTNSDSKPLQTSVPRAAQEMQLRVQTTVQGETKDVLMPSCDSARETTPAPSSAPMHGGVQEQTFRLLVDLQDKTNSIADVLGGLDRRIHGMEKTLTERPCVGSPPRRNPKRARSNRAEYPEKTTSGNRGKVNKPPSPKRRTNDDRNSQVAGETARASSARKAGRLRRYIQQLVGRGQIEQAFRTTLSCGTERDVLRLMGIAGGPDLCRRRLGMETRDILFAFIARTISAGRYTEHALPWVFELVRAGEAKGLPLAVRMQLAGALHGLAASPTDQGVMAARLGPYLSLASVGRSSMSDTIEGGGVFSGLGLGGRGG